MGEYHHLLMGTSHLREHSTSGDPMENKIMSSFVILTTHDVSPIFGDLSLLERRLASQVSSPSTKSLITSSWVLTLCFNSVSSV